MSRRRGYSPGRRPPPRPRPMLAPPARPMLPRVSSRARSPDALHVTFAGEIRVDSPREAFLDGLLQPRQLRVDRPAVLRPHLRPELLQHRPEPPNHLGRPRAVLPDLCHPEREVIVPAPD